MTRKSLPKSAYLGVFVVCVLLMLLAWHLADDGTPASAADWLGALATMFTLVLAVIAAWYLARAHEMEVNREIDRDDERKRAQAEQVTAWVYAPGRLWFSNPSALPIWDVEFLFNLPEGTVIRAEPLPILGPEREPRDILIEIDSSAVAGLAGWFNQLRDDTVGWPMVEIHFRDSAGRYWVREANGVLAAYLTQE